jgi:hypothetical protein
MFFYGSRSGERDAMICIDLDLNIKSLMVLFSPIIVWFVVGIARDFFSDRKHKK